MFLKKKKKKTEQASKKYYFFSLKVLNISILYIQYTKYSVICTHCNISSCTLCMFITTLTWPRQGRQYRTGGFTSLASDTIYFGYRSISVYRFEFTAIYIYIYIYVCVCIHYNKYKSLP